MVDSLYYSSRKITEWWEFFFFFCGLQNNFPKTLLFNEANYERFRLGT